MSADPTPLLDAEARDAFTERLDENFCISAGAGAGKTTAIVRRIANLALRRHCEPRLLSRLVVVTYGKLAAEELRVRTRDLVLEQLQPSASGRQTLLSELRGAFFGTIHSFCLKLIHDHGRYLGLPERLDLLEDRDVASLWEKFCDSSELFSLDLPAPLLERVGRHLTFDQLLDLAREFGPDETEAPVGFDPTAPAPVVDFSVALEDAGGRSKDRTRQHQQQLRLWLTEFESGAPFLELPHFTSGSGTFRAAVDLAVAEFAQWLNLAAGCLARRIAGAFRDYRLEKGLVTYRDQIFWCRQLLARPATLARLRQRGYIVILDEAQDTDADMFAILTEITRPETAPLGGWPGAGGAPAPRPGHFSFVGDDQQAIYSDRADLRVYRRYIDAFKAGEGGRYLEFSVTMRCPERVIAAVNGIFGGGRIEQESVRFRDLRPRPACPSGGAWLLDLSASDGSQDGRVTPETRFALECEEVASFVAGRGLAGLGLSAWSDLAVIAPRVAWLESAAEVFLLHGLPGSLLSQKRIARESPRHSWPAALLYVLIHPWDRFELIGVLREIFAVSDVDLARLHRASGTNGCPGLSFWPAVPEVIAKGKVPSRRLAEALALLHELRAALPEDTRERAASNASGATAQDRGTLSRYVDLVLGNTALAARLEVVGESPSALQTFRAEALRAECAGVTLRAWVRSLVEKLFQPMPRQPDGPDAIQFLTCQKAKGLEWPVVIPLGLSRQIGTRHEQFPRVERYDGETIIHFGAVTLDLARKEERAARAAEEFQRMLYVTLTRARQLLVVPDGRALYENKPPNFQALARWHELPAPALFTPASEAAAVLSVASAVPAPEIPWFVDDNTRLVRGAQISRRIPKRVLPSALVHQPAGTGVEPIVGAEEDDRARSSEEVGLATDPTLGEPLAGFGGIEYGNWWHEVLQHYPWSAAEDDRRADYIDFELGRIPAEMPWADRARTELLGLTTSAAHAWLLEAGAVFLAEMPFSHPRTAEQWVEGVMDLVVIPKGRNGIWILDWKTDRRRDSDATETSFLARIREKYRPQLREYAEVFARGFGREVEQLLLYSTEAGTTVEISR